MQNATRTLFSRCLSITSLLAVFAAATHAGEKCVDNPEFGEPDICVSFDGGTPAENVDFRVDFDTDPFNPKLELMTGSTSWNVRGDVPAELNLGSITLDPSSSSADFEITITYGAGPGANNVGEINLDGKLNDPNWDGYSLIKGDSEILGDLNGDLVVIVDSGGSGGTVSFMIRRDMTGDIEVGDIDSLVIEGHYDGDITAGNAAGLQIAEGLGQFNDGGFDSGSLAAETIEGGTAQLGKLDGVAIQITDKIDNGTLTVSAADGGASSTIVVEEVRNRSTVQLDGELVVLGEVPISLQVKTALGSGNAVTVVDELQDDLLFASDSGPVDIAGTVTLTRGIGASGTLQAGGLTGSGEITSNANLDGFVHLDGDVEENAAISMGVGVLNDELLITGNLAGDCDLNSIGQNGVLTIDGDVEETADIDVSSLVGSIAVLEDLEGDIDISNNVPSSGSIVVWGSTGSLTRILVHDDMDGTITVGDVSGSLAGDIEVDGELGGNIVIGNAVAGGDASGDIEIVGDQTGLIHVYGDLGGNIEIGDNSEAAVEIEGGVSGELNIGADQTATIDVTGDLSGQIEVGESMGDLATTSIGGAMTGTALIKIGDECDGDIVIGEGTEVNTLIDIATDGGTGLGDDGSIVTNATRGEFETEGDIYIGNPLIPAPPASPDPITF